MKTSGVAVLGLAVLLTVGCGEQQRRREIEQESRAFQQRELERLQEETRKMMEYQRGQDRILDSMRESERLRNEINRQTNDRLLQQQRLQDRYRPKLR